MGVLNTTATKSMRRTEDPCRDPASEARDDHASEPRATPETDALWIHCVRNPGPGSGLRIASHARRLERQRDELLEALEKFEGRFDCYECSGTAEAAIAAVKGGRDEQ